jgi:hypothetical protein
MMSEDFMAVGEKDEFILRWLMKRMHEILRLKRPALTLPEVGHFVQETHGAKGARAALIALGLNCFLNWPYFVAAKSYAQLHHRRNVGIYLRSLYSSHLRRVPGTRHAVQR